MTDEQFWQLIELLDWQHLGDDEEVTRCLVDSLQTMSGDDIASFDDRLAEKLFALDTEAHARHLGGYRGPDEFFSVDSFLYARCAVVVNGRDVYESTVKDATVFPREIEFEPILYVACKAFERKTGRRYDHVARPSAETFSNKSGWGVLE